MKKMKKAFKDFKKNEIKKSAKKKVKGGGVIIEDYIDG